MGGLVEFKVPKIPGLKGNTKMVLRTIFNYLNFCTCWYIHPLCLLSWLSERLKSSSSKFKKECLLQCSIIMK